MLSPALRVGRMIQPDDDLARIPQTPQHAVDGAFRHLDLGELRGRPHCRQHGRVLSQQSQGVFSYKAQNGAQQLVVEPARVRMQVLALGHPPNALARPPVSYPPLQLRRLHADHSAYGCTRDMILLHGDGRITQRRHVHVAHGHVVVTC